MIIFGSPSRYYQGPDCLAQVGPVAAAIGTRVVVVGRCVRAADAAGQAGSELFASRRVGADPAVFRQCHGRLD